MRALDTTEQVGKVFLVVGGMRICLACERVFTGNEAAEHAEIPCGGATKSGKRTTSHLRDRWFVHNNAGVGPQWVRDCDDQRG